MFFCAIGAETRIGGMYQRDLLPVLSLHCSPKHRLQTAGLEAAAERCFCYQGRCPLHGTGCLWERAAAGGIHMH
eukprot:4244580-Prorocentrum_lima.AAC.1